MQDGPLYRIASIRAMVSVEDTVFFLDWGPYDGGGGCTSDSVLRLRKLSLGGVGEVQTLATFYDAGVGFGFRFFSVRAFVSAFAGSPSFDSGADV
jgi:hypothetical protein